MATWRFRIDQHRCDRKTDAKRHRESTGPANPAGVRDVRAWFEATHEMQEPEPRHHNGHCPGTHLPDVLR